MVNYFLDKYNKKYNKDVVIGQSLLDMMFEYQWPGNVRELQNALECLVVINPSVVIERDNDRSSFFNLDVISYRPNSSIIEEIVSLDDAKKDFEKKIIQIAYQKYKSSYKVAEALKISQATANRKIREYAQDF